MRAIYKKIYKIKIKKNKKIVRVYNKNIQMALQQKLVTSGFGPFFRTCPDSMGIVTSRSKQIYSVCTEIDPPPSGKPKQTNHKGQRQGIRDDIYDINMIKNKNNK